MIPFTDLLTPMKIEYIYLDLESCSRCMLAEKDLMEALSELEKPMKRLGIRFDVVTKQIENEEETAAYRFYSSPTVRANGIDLLGAIEENDCADCSEISGTLTQCRTFIYKGMKYDSPPVPMLMEAILKVYFGLCDVKTEADYKIPENLKSFFDGKRKKIVK